MINGEANNCYYLGVRNLSELNSFGLLMGKKKQQLTTITLLKML